MRQFLSRAILSIGLLVGFSPASFGSAVYTIDVPNAGLAGFTGPYATVTVTLLDATHASITFDSLINGGFLYLMGGGQAADVSVNGAFTVGPIAATGLGNPGFVAPSCSSGGAGVADGFGSFSLTIDCFDGFTNAATQIAFTLTKSSGSWADDLDVLVANLSGNFAAVHAFACAVSGGDPATCSSTAGAAVTGFATNNTGPDEERVPEPETLVLLGLGLVLLAAARRRSTT